MVLAVADGERTGFGRYLQSLIDSRPGLSARRLAAYADVSPNTVNTWLRGMYVPRPESLAKLATKVNVPLEELMRAAGHLPESSGVEAPPPDAGVAMVLTPDEAAFFRYLRRMRAEINLSVKRVHSTVSGMIGADDELFYDWSGDKDEARERARDSGASP